MFLNRIEKYPGLIAALEEKTGLKAIAQATGLSSERLEALKSGAEHIMPAEEWALIGFCDSKNLYELLPRFGVAPPVYNRHAAFDFESGPLGEDLPPVSPELVRRPTRIAGHEVDFPFGISAGALTPNTASLRFFAERGFSILTHQTVRSDIWRGHKDQPHWAFVESVKGRMERRSLAEAHIVADMTTWPQHPRAFSMVNSFGVPSRPPKEWQAEIEEDIKMLPQGTLLIVSVMGTPEEAETEQDLVKDFALTARLAKETGAQIIEANYSCPNTKGGVENVYGRPDLSAAISKAIRQEIGSELSFFMKIGYLPEEPLKELVLANREWIDGIVAINTLKMSTVDASGVSLFPGRPEAGVSGSVIKPFAKEVLTNLVRLNEEEKLDLTILGVGGVTTAEDVEEFLELGVTAVLTCTGAYMNPYLAMEARLAQRVDRNRLREAFGQEALEAAERTYVTSTT